MFPSLRSAREFAQERANEEKITHYVVRLDDWPPNVFEVLDKDNAALTNVDISIVERVTPAPDLFEIIASMRERIDSLEEKVTRLEDKVDYLDEYR